MHTLMNNLLEVNIEKLSYLGSREAVLNDVVFTAASGDVILVSGSTGSGKTTLLNCVNGVIPQIREVACEGQITYNGAKHQPSPEMNLPFTCATVVQNPFHSFFISGMNYPPANENGKELLLKNTMQAKSALNLSAGERQRRALQDAFDNAPDILILDEPLSNLDAGGVDLFRKSLSVRSRQGGITLIAEHRTHFIDDLCTAEIPLKSGGDDCITVTIPAGTFPRKNNGDNLSGEILNLTGVGAKYQHNLIFSDVDLILKPGQCTGITGPNGSGKTTLGKIIAGLKKVDAGRIQRYGDPRTAIIYDDPRAHFFCSSVAAEIDFSRRNFGYSKQLTESIIGAMGLSKHKSANPLNLSYGLQVRLAAASMLAVNPDILILDEPTQGQDENGKQTLQNMIASLSHAGKSIVVISHSQPFLRDSCDRIYHLADGKLKEFH